MAVTAAVSGYAATFKKAAGTAVVELNKISGVSVNRETIECTNLDSPTQWKEFIYGLKEMSEITLEFNHLPTTATQVLFTTEMLAGTISSWIVTLPNATSTWTSNMLVMSFSLGDLEPGGKATASVTMRPTGALTLA